MFAAAPPAYVVALLIQVLWIPLRLLEMAGWDSLERHSTDINSALSAASTVLLVGASWELVRRGRGRVRIAMAVTFAMNLAGLGMQAFAVFSMFHRESSFDVLAVLGWVWPICAATSAVGLAIAAGRRVLATSIVVVVFSLVIFEVPPVSHAVIHTIGPALFWLFLVMVPLRSLLLVRVVGAIAQQCYAPVRDHQRASRGFMMLVWLFAVRTALALVIIAIGTSTELTQMWLVGIQVVVSLAFAYLVWRIAQTQLPQLPRYTVFFAVASVSMTVFMLAQNTLMMSSFGGSGWYESGEPFETSWSQLLPSTFGVAWLIVTLGRYAKQARSIKRSVVLGGAVFTTTTCWGLFARDATPTWVCVAIGSVAMIPAFRATAKALAGDPVQTTADVFG